MSEHLIDRRTLLRSGAGAAALGVAAPLLAACGGSPADKGSSQPSGRASKDTTLTGPTSGLASSDGTPSSTALPTYVPYPGVKPDLPSTGELVLPGFYQPPTTLAQFESSPPIRSGKAVSVMANTNIAVPPPLSSNRFWQQLNKEVGALMQYTMVTAAEYLPKFETTVAGNDLPEMMVIISAPGLPDLLQKRFTDLSEYLSGDNIKAYPGLANIPTISWRSSYYNGGMYTIPIPRSAVSGEMAVRKDISDKRGGNLDITSYADFLALCKAVNDPKNHSWAMGSPQATLNFVREMLGNANLWDTTGGQFTYFYEQDTYKQALSAVTDQWNQGLYHPDSFSDTNDLANWVGSGIVVMNNGGGTAGYYTTYKATGVSPALEMQLLVPPKYDGGGDGRKYYATADYGQGVAIRQNDKARVQELLRLSNWLAAPYGTKENQFLQYGVEGTDYTLKNGIPSKTTTGVSETALPVIYTGAPAFINTSPGNPAYVKQYWLWQQRCAKVAMTQPTLGLYSATDQTKGATLVKNLISTQNDIIQGRKKISTWDSVMKTWRGQGGDTIRKEYEAAYAKANG